MSALLRKVSFMDSPISNDLNTESQSETIVYYGNKFNKCSCATDSCLFSLVCIYAEQYKNMNMHISIRIYIYYIVVLKICTFIWKFHAY